MRRFADAQGWQVRGKYLDSIHRQPENRPGLEALYDLVSATWFWFMTFPNFRITRGLSFAIYINKGSVSFQSSNRCNLGFWRKWS
jgi:hypothetical protein